MVVQLRFNTTFIYLIPKIKNANPVAVKNFILSGWDFLHVLLQAMEWDFLHVLLQKMKYPEKFISLIMKCISVISYSVLLNAWFCAAFFFSGKRVKTGVPLSPYLFVLCAEVSLFYWVKLMAAVFYLVWRLLVGPYHCPAFFFFFGRR